MQVLKIGGNELQSGTFRKELARVLLSIDEPTVIVHGGGRAVAEMQTRLGQVPRMVDGLRVTDPQSLEVAQMVLSGQVNKMIVSELLAVDIQAIGLSGVDGGLLRCRKKAHPQADLGLVGEIVSVRTDLLQILLAAELVPVISPISISEGGEIMNVNADEAASALAAAITADRICFVSNVAAVLDADGNPISSMDAQEAAKLIDSGIIRDGMVPKVQAALDVVARGVAEAHILDLSGLSRLRGTRFSRSVPDRTVMKTEETTGSAKSSEE